MPAETPVTTPVETPTVAIDVLPLVHVPPPVASESVMVLPTATLVNPVIAAGRGLTVKMVVTEEAPTV